MAAFGLLDLQNMLSVSARNAKGSGSFSQYQKDLALFQAAERWRALTKATRRLDAVVLTPGTAALPSVPTGFLPEFEFNVYLTLAGQYLSPDIRQTTIQEVLQAQAECGTGTPATTTQSGQPRLIGFSTKSTATLFPTPDKAYSLNFSWWEDFTNWTFGQAFITANLSAGAIASFTINIPGSIYATAPTITITDPNGSGFVAGAVTVTTGAGGGGVATIAVGTAGTGYTSPTVFVNGVSAALPVFNLPNEHLLPIATMGAKYFLMQAEPANADAAAKAYADFESQARRFAARGAGGLGVQTIKREDPDWKRGGSWRGCE